MEDGSLKGSSEILVATLTKGLYYFEAVVSATEMPFARDNQDTMNVVALYYVFPRVL